MNLTERIIADYGWKPAAEATGRFSAWVTASVDTEVPVAVDSNIGIVVNEGR